MDSEISILHQRISRLMSEAGAFSPENQEAVDLDHFIETQWHQLTSQIAISAQDAGRQGLTA